MKHDYDELAFGSNSNDCGSGVVDLVEFELDQVGGGLAFPFIQS